LDQFVWVWFVVFFVRLGRRNWKMNWNGFFLYESFCIPFLEHFDTHCESDVLYSSSSWTLFFLRNLSCLFFYVENDEKFNAAIESDFVFKTRDLYESTHESHRGCWNSEERAKGT
jgi:hypothetical protein